MNCHLWAFAWISFSVALFLAFVFYNFLPDVAGMLRDRYADGITDAQVDRINQSICDYRNMSSSAIWLSLTILAAGFIFYMVVFFVKTRMLMS